MALMWTALAVVLLCLIPARVRITSVTGEQGPVRYFTQERSVTISGTISDPRANQVFLDLDGAVRPVAVQAGEFHSTVSLIPGINRVVVSPRAQAPELLGGSETVQLFAVVPPSDIWSELTWDGPADIDLHLLDPRGEDCFWNHRVTAQGATLDYDNQEAYGPEHITLFSATPGTYKLQVVYFATRPNVSGKVRWRVNLRLGNGSVKTYSGILSQQGDSQTAAEFTF